jgi:hypothetical protein
VQHNIGLASGSPERVLWAESPGGSLTSVHSVQKLES